MAEIVLEEITSGTTLIDTLLAQAKGRPPKKKAEDDEDDSDDEDVAPRKGGRKAADDDDDFDGEEEDDDNWDPDFEEFDVPKSKKRQKQSGRGRRR